MSPFSLLSLSFFSFLSFLSFFGHSSPPPPLSAALSGTWEEELATRGLKVQLLLPLLLVLLLVLVAGLLLLLLLAVVLLAGLQGCPASFAPEKQCSKVTI